MIAVAEMQQLVNYDVVLEVVLHHGEVFRESDDLTGLALLPPGVGDRPGLVGDLPQCLVEVIVLAASEEPDLLVVEGGGESRH